VRVGCAPVPDRRAVAGHRAWDRRRSAVADQPASSTRRALRPACAS